MKVLGLLTKSGIVVFVLLSAFAGYAMSFSPGQILDWSEILYLLIGLYFVSGGSFALNQAQEWRIDAKMVRTMARPIPNGKLAPWQVYLISVLMMSFGLLLLAAIEPLAAALALLTVILYNGFYTLLWKRRLAFGAVPGAIPGAMPVLIGYSVNNTNIFSPDAIYMFLIMFLWQMPHFWCLAIRYKKDYEEGGIPVLPASIGVSRTLYHIGLYLFAYVGLAMASPWFLRANVLYVLVVFPICVKLMLEFFKYYRSDGEKSWLPFFLWTNFSMLLFLGVPIFDKWVYFFSL